MHCRMPPLQRRQQLAEPVCCMEQSPEADAALPDMHAIYMWLALTFNAQFVTCYALRPAMPPER